MSHKHIKDIELHSPIRSAQQSFQMYHRPSQNKWRQGCADQMFTQRQQLHRFLSYLRNCSADISTLLLHIPVQQVFLQLNKAFY